MSLQPRRDWSSPRKLGAELQATWTTRQVLNTPPSAPTQHPEASMDLWVLLKVQSRVTTESSNTLDGVLRGSA